MGTTDDCDDPGLRNIGPDGMQETYLVLSDEERAKGFVRPVRRTYRHLTCGTVTTMGQAIAETYARDPKFYGGTFCVGCRDHFPVGERGQFVWDGDVLDALLQLYPEAGTQTQVAEMTGYSPTASTIGVALSKLRKVEVVTGWRISDDFADSVGLE